jgi:hypothetical protein
LATTTNIFFAMKYQCIPFSTSVTAGRLFHFHVHICLYELVESQFNGYGGGLDRDRGLYWQQGTTRMVDGRVTPEAVIPMADRQHQRILLGTRVGRSPDGHTLQPKKHKQE